MNMFGIKTVAIISMIIDHFGLFFFPGNYILLILGRISFPLIAWLIANGARHTHDINKYLLRLFAFALISQIPFELGFYLSGVHTLFLNVLFTLVFGLLAIKILKENDDKLIQGLAILSCTVSAALLNTDYGAAGVLSIVAFYIFFDKKLLMVITQTLILFVIPVLVHQADLLTPLHLSRAYMAGSFEGIGLLALPIIFLYNGKRGPRVQYFFYAFFPLQSFAILALKLWY